MLENQLDDQELSIREFAEGLWETFSKWREGQGKGMPQTGGDGMETGLLHGWLEPQDVTRKEEFICRGDAARILHEFVQRELGEADDEDWGAVREIKDLYDCRVCVKHVAQMICKGIMTAKDGVFARGKHVKGWEAKAAFQRLLEPGTRLAADKKTAALPEQVRAPKKLTKDEAMRMLKECAGIRFLDVRTPGEHAAGSPEGAENLPLLQLISHPERAASNLETPILLGCDGGYRSEMAALRLKEAGYANVSYFGWKS